MKPIANRYFADLPKEVAVVATVAFCVALGFGIVAPVVPLFAQSFGVSAFAASSVISLFALMRFVSATPSGWLVNKFGERWVLSSGLTIVAVSSALAGCAQTFTQLIVLRGLGGTGSAMFTVSAMSLLLRSVDSQHRGRATSLYQSGFLFGGLAGPAVGGLVVGFSIRAPFFVYAFTLMLAVIATIVGLPKGLGHPTIDPEVTAAEKTSPMALKSALKIRNYWTAMSVNLTTGMTAFGLRSSLLPIFVIEELHRDARTSSLGFLTSSLAQALFLMPAGRMADAKGRKPPIIFGTALLCVSLGALIVDHSLLVFLLSMAMMGLSSAFLGAAPAAIVGDIVGNRKGGQVVGVYQMTSDLGIVVGPLLAGYLRDVTGGFTWPFLAGLIISLITLAMTTTITESRSQKTNLDTDYSTTSN